MSTERKPRAAQRNGRARVVADGRTKRSPHPIFDALIMEAMLAPREDLLRTDEVARELGITEQERSAAREQIARWEPDGPDEAEGVEKAEGGRQVHHDNPTGA